MGTTSLILGICSIICGIISPLLGVILGIIGIITGKQAKKRRMKNGSKGCMLSIIGIITSVVVFAVSFAMSFTAAISTLDDSKKDSFAIIANEYIVNVRNANLIDSIECSENASESAVDFKAASQLGNGEYYIFVTTDKNVLQTNNYGFPSDLAQQAEYQTSTLVKDNGNSPWNNANVYGWIHWKKENTSSTYYIALVDELGHGIVEEEEFAKLYRSSVLEKDAKADTNNIYNMINNYNQTYYCHLK